MTASSTAARLAFFGMSEDAPAPLNPTRARVDAVAGTPSDPGPSKNHRFHGAIQLSGANEIRVSTQAARVTRSGQKESARLIVRRWHLGHGGWWWTSPTEPGITISAGDAEAFGRAVAAAVEALTAGKAKS